MICLCFFSWGRRTVGLFQPPAFTFKGSWRHRGSLACFSYFLFSIFCWNVPLTNSVLDRGPYWESELHSWRSTAKCVRVGRGVFVGLLPSSPSQCSFSTDGEEFHHTHSYTHTYKNLFLFYCSVYLDINTHSLWWAAATLAPNLPFKGVWPFWRQL